MYSRDGDVATWGPRKNEGRMREQMPWNGDKKRSIPEKEICEATTYWPGYGRDEGASDTTAGHRLPGRFK